MNPIKIVILALLAIQAFCIENMSIGELPSDIADELQALSEHSLNYQLKVGCKGSFMRITPTFLLHTRNNRDNPIVLNITNPTELDPVKKVVILVHGWLASPATDGIVKLRNAYLKRYDCNVIVVNWSKAAWQPYSTTYCFVPGVAQFIAKALCHLNQLIGLPLDKIHLVGHSMGAHISGWAGKFISKKCKASVGRITGLDPSGPIFGKVTEGRRLDKSDALFVDVIHTDGGSFGAGVKMGHADFYVNCGQHQPGCSDVSQASNETLLSNVFCNHHRSMEYMAESVNSNNYIAASCGMCPRYCRVDAISELYRLMGEDCRQETRPTRNFYIPTSNSPPYFYGWEAYSGISSRVV